MIGGFEFQDDRRTYSCTVEEQHGTQESWWWFAVTGDAQRYSPFRAARADTQASVRQRIIAYYENRRFQLTQPTVKGGPWKQQAEAKRAAAQKAAAEAAEASTAKKS